MYKVRSCPVKGQTSRLFSSKNRLKVWSRFLLTVPSGRANTGTSSYCFSMTSKSVPAMLCVRAWILRSAASAYGRHMTLWDLVLPLTP